MPIRFLPGVSDTGVGATLSQRGHRVTFLECDRPWYADNRDAATLPYCTTHLYGDVADLIARFHEHIRRADVVIVGSYTVDGIQVCEWVQEEATGVKAFYDIDTPVTIGKLKAGTCEYLSRELIACFDVMLSGAALANCNTVADIEALIGNKRA